MEPAYWQMQRLARNLPLSTPQPEFTNLELTPPPPAPPQVQSDPDTPIVPEAGETPLLSAECGRVITHGAWRTLRPPATA